MLIEVMVDDPNCLIKKRAQTAFLRSNKENQELTTDNRAVSVENPFQKPN